MTKTKTIEIGKQDIKFNNKPIEFLGCLTRDWDIRKCELEKPEYYGFIELICNKYNGDFDLMFAYDDPKKRENGVLYIGKWNDGVVEQYD